MITEINDSVTKQIHTLKPFEERLTEQGPTIKITHRLVLSMIDGKVKATLMSKGPQSCLTCGVTPKDMNDIPKALALPLNSNAFHHGIPILHGWIRFLELCLHVAYRLEVKKGYQRYTPSEKEQMEVKKKDVQQKLWEYVGIHVDKVNSSLGSGNTNTGNTARRFFEDSTKTAASTGLDSAFLERIRVVMVVLSSGFAVDVAAFRSYAVDTAKMYVQLYGWYYMSASVRNILLHGADYIAACPIPISFLSEEALEARHKDIRHFRRHNTRLCNRRSGNEDLLHALLISSDPVINTHGATPKPKTLKFSTVMLSLVRDHSCTAILSVDLFIGSDDQCDIDEH